MNNKYILPKGFRTSGIYCGIKKNKKLDVGLIYSDKPCICETFWTSNKLKSWHILYDSKLKQKSIRAIFVNSGNANVLNGIDGLKSILKITKNISEYLNIEQSSILMASTGKISKKMPDDKIIKSLPELISRISSKDKNLPEAILTTDTKKKTYTDFIKIDDKKVTITGVAKGAGMISPALATMLVFIMTDASIERKFLRIAAKEAIEKSFNRITVDGDMSPNDSVFILSNGMAGNSIIDTKDFSFKKFADSISNICYALAEDIVRDGEGATKFIKINIVNSKNKKQAQKVARAIANSPLVKTAFFGCSLNFGRIISAIGSTGLPINVYNIDLKINGIFALKNQKIINEKIISKEMKKRDLTLEIDLKSGKEKYFILTTDLSYDYIRINADYT
ncbi:MAG: bifunctional glutamate N-acetyltransferase/amino-acid acetyltransferase ArgJ [Candidatus Goldbacteria bacterium]|nr:bifunctional glutamate N-acetyltransferase/amino-acid acetyltransferase ArgJ [Candidatus Goldiibacteriota bacterium]